VDRVDWLLPILLHKREEEVTREEAQEAGDDKGKGEARGVRIEEKRKRKRELV